MKPSERRWLQRRADRLDPTSSVWGTVEDAEAGFRAFRVLIAN